MVYFSEELRSSLNLVAHEMSEVSNERGYRVSVALELDEAFIGSGRSRSSLQRDLAVDGFMLGGSRAGLSPYKAGGGAYEFGAEILGSRMGVFRLRKARQLADGSFRVVANTASTWGDIDDDTLIVEIPFVFGYTMTEGHVGVVFVAEVTGVVIGNPGELILGPITLLNATPPTTGGFVPDEDEGLPGMEDDDDDIVDSDAA